MVKVEPAAVASPVKSCEISRLEICANSKLPLIVRLPIAVSTAYWLIP